MGREVGKGSEFEVCPICGKTDWCFVVFGGESPKINCKRIDERVITGVDGAEWRRTNESPKLGANYILASVVDDYRRKLRKDSRQGPVAVVPQRPRLSVEKPQLDLTQRMMAPRNMAGMTAQQLQPLQWSVVNEDECSVEREVVYPYPSVSLMALNDFFLDAFGEQPLTIEEKRRLFYEAYAATISPENWREMDREEILRLALPGDEEQLQDGRWNRSAN